MQAMTPNERLIWAASFSACMLTGVSPALAVVHAHRHVKALRDLTMEQVDAISWTGSSLRRSGRPVWDAVLEMRESTVLCAAKEGQP